MTTLPLSGGAPGAAASGLTAIAAPGATTGTNASPSFDNAMDDALNTGSGTAKTDSQPQTSAPAGDDAAFSKKILGSADTDSTDASSATPAQTLTVALSAQVVLALAATTATPAPTTETPSETASPRKENEPMPHPESSSVEAGILPSATAELEPAPNATVLPGIRPSPASPSSAVTTISQPSVASSATPLATPDDNSRALPLATQAASQPAVPVPATATSATQMAARVMAVSSAAPSAPEETSSADCESAEPVVAEAEKITAKTSETRIKIPVSGGGRRASEDHSRNPFPAANSETTAQSSPNKTDIPAPLVAPITVDDASTFSADTAGTDRAGVDAMQTLRDLWPNSAFRLLAYGENANSPLSMPPATGRVETVTLSSNNDFAAAVQKAIDTPSEIYPRRIEIQLHTPPGASVTLSLTQVNGELRAQFGASNTESLNWLRDELQNFQAMNFGLTVRWSPPQLVAQQPAETRQEQPDREKPEQRRRDGERRRNQPSTDAFTTEAAAQAGASTSGKG